MKSEPKTKYTPTDYAWVRKQISLQHPTGISGRDLQAISKKEGRKLGMRPRNEKPPGRDKIGQILEDGCGIDWDYNESRGGRGNKSTYAIRTQDPAILLEKTVHAIAYEELLAGLDTLYKKRETKFRHSDYFDFVKIRNRLLSHPMKVYHYGEIEKGLRKDVMFNSLVSSVRIQLEKIRKIEKSQNRLDRNFAEVVRNIDELNDRCIDRLIVDPSSDIKEHLTPRNTLRRLLRIKT